MGEAAYWRNGGARGLHCAVGPGVIDGDDWIARRVAFLRERLAGELSDGERQAVEAEIEALSTERGIMPGGIRFGRFWRRLRRRPRR